MAEETWRSNLATFPFPQVLFKIWQRRDTGHLGIHGEGVERSVCFVKGDLALGDGHFSNDLFLKKLLSDQALNPRQAEECARHARENDISLPRTVIERGIATSSRVWDALAGSWMEDLCAVFDWPRPGLVFQPGATLQDSQIYAVFPTPPVILRGIRGMKNHDLIESYLPAETAPLHPLSPPHAGLLQLAPHEKHVLGILRQSPRLGDLCIVSQAGKRETQKVVFALLTLGLAGSSPAAGGIKAIPELSSPGLEKIWSTFNDKCSYIHRYISKEIGPVGLSVLEKALEEVRTRLAPPFQGLELRVDGRVEFSPFPMKSLPFFTEETQKNFIGLLNEILVAEVLAVKKTLGSTHETVVVRTLEKIGEPS